MKNIFVFTLLLMISGTISGQQQEDIPHGAQKLLKAYPEQILDFNRNHLILRNGSQIEYKESVDKSHTVLLNSNNLGDIFHFPYPKGKIDSLPVNFDPGRIRNEELLKQMYGSTSIEVQKNLVSITWCPKLVNQKLRVTKINGVDKQLQKISDELDNYPELKDYLKSSGVFNWRKIRGSDRLSAHSFGTAIDLNVKYSNYWQWDCRCTSENKTLSYKNRIPQIIVDIFEKHGFIWGGKWYHYDTMHFEYRPELLID